MIGLGKLIIATLLINAVQVAAESAQSVLAKDYAFPHKIDGLPSKLSDFTDLQINSFTTSDGVRLAYWEAGSGKPLIFVPAWSANGANYINVLYLLSKYYHVYVLDVRNQGLSQKVNFGNRIYRYSMDLREFVQHTGVKSAYYCGWSMGVSVLYGHIDLFGTNGIEKLALIDEPPSILSRPGMTPEERLKSGAIADSVQGVAAAMSAHTATSLMERYNAMDSLPYANSKAFAREIVPVDNVAVSRIMYDHASIDWRDVIRTKINVPTAIFTGEYSANVPSQEWMKSVIPNSTLYIYSKAEQGDHFLAFKNPFKFVTDLRSFLDAGQTAETRTSGAAQENGIARLELLRTNTAWNGVSYAMYPSGSAEPVVAEITIPAHGELPWHSHPMPSFAYVLAGEITVEDKQGNKKHFTHGQVMPETVNTAHRGIVGDQPATFIVFYAGTRGVPLSVPAN
jgi:pimeloyl-ACP methyl ester carboxylesterase/quercetin dioxygenase-like cupin family protein